MVRLVHEEVGKLAVYCTYGYSGEGVDTLNDTLARAATAHGQTGGIPYAIGGDWNMQGHEFEQWLKVVAPAAWRGRPRGDTYVSGGHASELDFWVVHRDLRPFIKGQARVDREHGIAGHSVVSIDMGMGRSREQLTVLSGKISFRQSPRT